MGRSGQTLRTALASGVALLAVTTAPSAAQAPPTTATAAPPEQAWTTVVDEASYRDALEVFSTAPSGPNTIEIAADLVVDDGTDPTYTGDADLIIEGHGHTIDGGGANRLLVVDAPSTTDVTVREATLIRGHANGHGGAVEVSGGASLAFERATLADSQAGGDGGAVATTAHLEMEDTTVSGNAAPDGYGGGVRAGDAVGLTRVTFSGNRARLGGALATIGDAAFIAATITGNEAVRRGGGLYVDGQLRLIDATVVANVAPVGANVAFRHPPSMIATVLADPVGGGANCAPALAFRATASFSDDLSCGGPEDGWAGTDGTDALLGPLQDNGGATATMEPRPESPLVDAVDPLRYWAGPTLSCTTYDDQRGVTRPQDGNGRPETGGNVVGPYGPATVWCDIGAVEREAPPAPPAPVPLAPRFTG